MLLTARQNLTAHRLHFLASTASELLEKSVYCERIIFVLKLQIVQLRQLEAVGPDRFKLFVYGRP